MAASLLLRASKTGGSRITDFGVLHVSVLLDQNELGNNQTLYRVLLSSRNNLLEAELGNSSWFSSNRGNTVEKPYRRLISR